MTPQQQKLMAAGIVIVFFVVISMAIAGTDAWQEPMPGHSENLDHIVEDLFDDHVIALEVLGVLLTAAMIGALVIARPMEAPLDSTHYATVDDDTMDDTARISDAGAAFPIVDVGGEEE